MTSNIHRSPGRRLLLSTVLMSSACVGAQARELPRTPGYFHSRILCTSSSLDSCVLAAPVPVATVIDEAVSASLTSSCSDSRFEIGQTWQIEGYAATVVATIDTIWCLEGTPYIVTISVDGLEGPGQSPLIFNVGRPVLEHELTELVDQRTPTGDRDRPTGMFLSVGTTLRSARMQGRLSATMERVTSAIGDASPPPPTGMSDPTLSTLAAAELITPLSDLGLSPQLEGNQILVGNHSLAVNVFIEKAEKVGERLVLIARFEIYLDGNWVPASSLVGVGEGPDWKLATATSVHNWSMFGGVAFTSMFALQELADIIGPIPELRLQDWWATWIDTDNVVAIAGMPYFEHDEEVTRSADTSLDDQIIQRVLPHLDRSRRYTSLMVEAEASERGLEAITCRLDGVDSAPMAAHLASMQWPTGGRYTFMRYYVIQGAK